MLTQRKTNENYTSMISQTHTIDGHNTGHSSPYSRQRSCVQTSARNVGKNGRTFIRDKTHCTTGRTTAYEFSALLIPVIPRGACLLAACKCLSVVACYEIRSLPCTMKPTMIEPTPLFHNRSRVTIDHDALDLYLPLWCFFF